jgi:hypothetical protein
MGVESLFEVDDNTRAAEIEIMICRFPHSMKKELTELANHVVNEYAGRDADAVSVLKLASQKGRFAEYAQKLEGYYRRTLQRVKPEDRHGPKINEFFSQCYADLNGQL